MRTTADVTGDKPIAVLFDGRCGVVMGLLSYYARGRGFPHSANICVHEHVCLYWVWVFLCIICIYKKNVYKYVFIRYLNSIIQAL
jgi:hypothetical protein